MSKNLLSVPTLSLLFSIFLFSSVSGQSINFQVHNASREDDAEYKKQFKEYTLATLATLPTSDMLRSKNDFKALEIVAGDKKFKFDLYAQDIRAANFKLVVSDENGVREMPGTPNTTYAGYTLSGNYDVRITADDNFFHAMIVQANDEFYIEPASDIVPSAPKDLFVMYWSSDNLKKMTEDACKVKIPPPGQMVSPEDESKPEVGHGSRDVCKTVQIALADDHLMFNKYGSVAAVTNHNMAVINDVLTNYDTEFSTDLDFSVVEVHVATTAQNDPWTTSTDPSVLLDNFTNWGPTGFTNVHDVASLWTNREFDGTTIGIAWIASICTNFCYNTLQDFSNNSNLLRVLQAHEMGHGFSANHDAPNSGFIMAPAVTNTNTWSSLSLTDINGYIPTRQCLSSCSSGAPPVANFSADETDGCVPMTVHFLDQSSNSPTSWLWTFQGGTPPTSTLQFPTVVYNSTGSFNVTLKATNALGNSTLTKPGYITVNNFPTANFDYVKNGLVVEFDNISQNATSYFWTFGDGGTSTQESPNHTYPHDGFYLVTLTATSNCGSHSKTVEIEILTLPEADFIGTPTQGCAPFEVDFTNFSSDNAVTYFWQFPGGAPSTSTEFEPLVLYENPGTYNVSLTVSNPAGNDVLLKTNYITVNPIPVSTFTYTIAGFQVNFNSAGSSGDLYNWNFGDGQTSTLHNPTHVYSTGGSYNVTLTVSNICGQRLHQATVVLGGAPVAAFNSNVQEGCGPLTVQYTNLSTGLNNQYSWVFEGGVPATSTLPNPTVVYNSPGSFDVSLTATNTFGSNNVLLQNYITVFPLPISNFTFIITGSQATFINSSSSGTTSLWHFGDGGTSNLQNPVHTYGADGTYNVTLISSGQCGNDTSSTQLTITTPPVASFAFSQNELCAPATVQYTNLSSQNTTSVLWTFVGGTPSTSTQFNPLVTYNNPGTFDTRLISFSAGGSDTMTWPQIVTVDEATQAAFLINTNGTTVTLENQSTGADTYFWSFGDGHTSTETGPSHTYSGFGTYSVSLITANECGSDTMSVILNLSTIPNALFSYDTHTGCLPLTVTFDDQSQNSPTSWLWSFDGGDPLSSTVQNPTVVYNAPGNYSVSLRVENGSGSDVLVLTDVINVAGPPDATFDYEINGNFVSLTYLGTDYDSLHWNFGDGRTDASLNPTVEYINPGLYLVSLTIYNGCGTDTKSVIVDILGTATNDPSANASHWQLRPNPFGDKLSIYGEPAFEGSTIVTLLDVHGRIISTENWNHSAGPSTRQIDANNLPFGIVLIQLQDKDSRVVLMGVHQ